MAGRPTISDKTWMFGTIIVIVIMLALCAFLVNIISNATAALVPLVAGTFLVIGNARDLVSLWRSRKPSHSMFNAMIGISLVLFGLGTAIFGGSFFRFILFAPAVALLIAAIPMALGRPSIYNTYGAWARKGMAGVRSVVSGRHTSSGASSQGQQTIEIRPHDIMAETTQIDEQRRR